MATIPGQSTDQPTINTQPGQSTDQPTINTQKTPQIQQTAQFYEDSANDQRLRLRPNIETVIRAFANQNGGLGEKTYKDDAGDLTIKLDKTVLYINTDILSSYYSTIGNEDTREDMRTDIPLQILTIKLGGEELLKVDHNGVIHEINGEKITPGRKIYTHRRWFTKYGSERNITSAINKHDIELKGHYVKAHRIINAALAKVLPANNSQLSFSNFLPTQSTGDAFVPNQ